MPQRLTIHSTGTLDPRWSSSEWLRGVRALLDATDQQVVVRPCRFPAEEEENHTEKRGLWKRKAAQRRLQKRQKAGAEEASYEPVFQNLRLQDSGPTFELPEEQLAGRVLPVANAEARWRARAAIWAGTLLTTGMAAAAGAFMLDSANVIDARLTAEISGPPTPARQLMIDVQHQAAKVPAARAAVEAFFNCRTPGEKAAFVRGGAAMLPALSRYYALRPDEPAGFHLRPELDFGTDSGREYIFMGGTDAGGKVYDTVVELTPDGPRLDWRFLTGMGEMEWSTWLRQRPRQDTVLRAEAVLDDYYAGVFGNAREWLCLKLTDAEKTATVWAYTPRMSQTGLTLFRQLNDHRTPVRLTATLAFPAGAWPGAVTAPQVHLRKVATQGWLDRCPDAAPEDVSPVRRQTSHQSL